MKISFAIWMQRTVLIAASSALLLTACNSVATTRYHTLSNHDGRASKVASSVTNQDGEAIVIEVLPVHTADALASAQLMLRSRNGGMESSAADRWTTPLPQELRTAISLGLQERLGAVDSYGVPGAERLKRLQVSIALARADVSTNGYFSAVVQWTVRAMPSEEVLIGRTNINLDIADDADGQVIAFQRLSNSVVADVAVAVRALSLSFR
ncbi:PqiC family protein [Herbaspirillum camelliae]|uniref:PqiC family protein n=1 Tax=Herbaspirillum camelliae TaxID=1892903 RepID=UPI000949F5D0|nr:ABC-type transport auxiliary lipoprotein family protein [Herbaspirillum camelliae]